MNYRNRCLQASNILPYTMSLKHYITARYGTSTFKATTQLKDVKVKQAILKNQWIFLERCLAHRLVPKAFRIKSPVKNERAERIMIRYRHSLLVSIKNDTKKKYFRTTQKIEEIRIELQNILSAEDFQKVKQAAEMAREKTFVHTKSKLRDKFDKMKGERNDGNTVNPTEEGDAEPTNGTQFLKEGVLNLCSEEMKDSHRELLNLGPKFVPRVNNIPWMELVSRTESAALKLEFSKKETEAQSLRRDVLRLLKMNKPKKDNLTREQRKAMKEIVEDENISIYPFDKGVGFVRIKKEDAFEKIKEQIGETTILDRDPTPTFAAKIRSELSKMNKAKKFTAAEYELVYPSDPVPPRLYGVVKAHKPQKNFPMRTIVSTIGTATHGLSEYLVKLIQPALNKNVTRLKNSSSFVNKAKTWEILAEEVQVSYDVVNLYPKVPLKESTNVILDMVRNDPDILRGKKIKINDVKKLIELCLSKCYFLWNDEIHELKDSGPIGLSLMVVMAEGFLQYIESKALQTALNPPKSYVRYVDDSHARFDLIQHAHDFKTVLNQQHQNIQYTLEEENQDKELEFLDVKTKNNSTGRYEFSVHRKEAITNIQVKPHSDHDPKILEGIFKGFIHRAFTICSPQHLDEELEFLKGAFIENGYKENDLVRIISEITRKKQRSAEEQMQQTEATEEHQGMVSLPWVPGLSPKLRKAYKKAGYKVVFKSGKNLSTILTSKNKPQLPRNSHPGVYRIQCTKHPNNPYIGHTKKQIRSRISEHKEYARKSEWDKSGAAGHSKECDGIKWDEVRTITREKSKFEREVREAMEIQRNRCGPDNGGMNVDLGKWVKTKFWLPFFKSLENKTSNTATQDLTSEDNNTAVLPEGRRDRTNDGIISTTTAAATEA